MVRGCSGTELEAALDAVGALDPSQLADGETVLARHRQVERLPAVCARARATALRRIDDGLFEADRAETRARVGEGVCAADLARTPAQRRADALVEMARRAGAVPEGARLPEPLFSVLVGYETFAGPMCELAAEGTVIAPGSLLGWLGQAWVERVVFDGPDRVTNVGVRRRMFTGATRRGGGGARPGVLQRVLRGPAGDCEIDRVVPYAAGGPTVVENGRVTCGYHNRLRHRRRGPPDSN